jgi:periplasmic protein TonB
MSSPRNSALMESPRQLLARSGYANTAHRSAYPNVRAGAAKAPDQIWGQYNNYRANGFAVSAVVHVCVIGLLLSGIFVSHQIVERAQSRQVVTLVAPSPDSYALPLATRIASGGGGGGDRDMVPAPKGHPPKATLEQQITPPAIVLHNAKPKLPVEPTVVAPPQVKMADNHIPSLGVDTKTVMPSAPPSNGMGSGGGIGSGAGGGVGVGHGPGLGAGSGGGIGGGVYHVGGGISAPLAISTPDPEYTEEARRAKTQGTCILWLIVDSQGRPRDIRVVRGLGYGLDGKAVEAVRQWRFQPSRKDGKPVDVQISVEVAFHLY